MEDVLFNIFTFFKCKNVISNMNACKMFYKTGKSQLIWKYLVSKKYQTKFYKLSWFDTYRICYKLINNLAWCGTFNELLEMNTFEINRTYFRTSYVTITKEIDILTNLREFSLCSKKINHFPIEICKLINLEYLYLSFNKITYVPPEIGQLTNLEVLALHSNQIVNIPIEIGLLTKLMRLYLDNNKINFIPMEMCKLTNLISLHLDSNQIAYIPSEIGQLTQLNYLSLFGNTFTIIPKEICELQSVRL